MVSPAVQALHAQQLHPVLAGGVVLGFAAAQVVQRKPGESGVVPEAVAIGNRRGQLLVEGLCLASSAAELDAPAIRPAISRTSPPCAAPAQISTRSAS